MSLSPELVAQLVCPRSREPLLLIAGDGGGDFLYCPASRLRYRIDDGIPVLLPEEAEEVDKVEAERLMERSR